MELLQGFIQTVDGPMTDPLLANVDLELLFAGLVGHERKVRALSASGDDAVRQVTRG
jgi:hypothetical protein